MAPPSTPAQPPFLLSKRQAPPQPPSQRQTPATLQNGSHQFASTPRFTVSETPRKKVHHQPQHEHESDAIDTSPISPGFADQDDEASDQEPLNESIELDSPSASRSLPGQDAERPPKRRRVSISPDPDSSPPAAGGGGPLVADEPMVVDDDGLIEVGHTPSAEDEQLRSPPRSPTDLERPRTGSEPASPSEPAARRPPTFRAAPRFKATADAAAKATADCPPLPDAFSPQRRGAKYVPGGLAAEVRDWLVQVKGASDYDRPAGASVQMKADEARDGGDMWIVGAHEVDASPSGRTDGNPAKAILAGGGRISELGKRHVVRTGSTVSMYQPMWDINLRDLGRFAVVCDWEAVD